MIPSKIEIVRVLVLVLLLMEYCQLKLILISWLTDLAYDILKKKLIDRANRPNSEGITPLHLLANKPSVFRSGCYLGWRKNIIYYCKYYSDVLASQLQIRSSLLNCGNPSCTQLATLHILFLICFRKIYTFVSFMIKWDISICVHCPTSPVVIYPSLLCERYTCSRSRFSQRRPKQSQFPKERRNIHRLL